MTATDAGASQKPFRILTVCTGNICRSPMAELLLQTGLDTVSPGQFLVESAGSRAVVGSLIHPSIEAKLDQMGISSSSFRSRQLQPKMIRDADLVLAMSREHRAKIVTLEPSGLSKAFTIRELARIAPQIPPSYRWRDRWDELIRKSRRSRTAMSATSVSDDDIIDPIGLDQMVFDQMADQLTPAVMFLLQHERAAKTQ